MRIRLTKVLQSSAQSHNRKLTGLLAYKGLNDTHKNFF